MEAAVIGLGRMGANMARRLLKGGVTVHVYNRTYYKALSLEKEGAKAYEKIHELVGALTAPRTLIIMLPAGEPVQEHVKILSLLLEKGDTLIEGGNSFYKDDISHFEVLKQKGIYYLDAGISGGIWGLENGYCTMVGGEEVAFKKAEPLFKLLAPENGYMYCGPAGSGHFVKMVHNGIEYAMMQSYAEGFNVLKSSPYAKDLDLEKVSNLWNQGSVIRSWLLELLEKAFKEDPDLESINSVVEDSGEGRWTVQQAVETRVPVPVIASALFERFSSQDNSIFANRVLAALRKEFGGHIVK
jgi:6-phosphogluconate dehydrogenase